MTIVLNPSVPVRYDAGDSTTFWNTGPDTAYYADTGNVSSTSYDGSIPLGGTVELSDELFFIVAPTAERAVLETTFVNDDDDPDRPTLRSMLPINVKDLYAIGDNATDDTEAIQAAITNAAGKEVVFPDGTYVVSDSLTVSAGTRLVATGTTTLRMTHETAPLFIVEGDNVLFDGLLMDGPYDPMTAWPDDLPGIEARKGSYAIRCWAPLSDATGRPDVDEPISGLKIQNCRVRYFGAGAVWTWHSHNQTFFNNEISDCGRDGFRVYSSSVTTATHNHIHDISPGFAGNDGFLNCYGYTFTRYSSDDTDTTVEPNCEDCTVAFNHIHDIPSWNGIDSHGGRRMKFCFNVIERCWNPIGFDDGDSEDGTVHSPLRDVTIIGNTLDNTGLTETGPGINYGGSDTPLADQARRLTIVNNTIIECGSNTTNYPGGTYGAVSIHNLHDGLVSGNHFKDCYGACVWAEGLVTGLKVHDNTFEDVQTIDSVGAAIHSEDDTFSAHIAGNTYTRNTGSDDFNAYHWPTLAAGYRVRIGDGEINTQAGITKYNGTEYLGPTGTGFLAPRAWARVTVSGGVATLTAKCNIDSVTYNATGDVSVSIDTNVYSDATTTPMVTILSDSDRRATVKATGLAASGFRVLTRDDAGAAVDCSFAVVVYGVPA